MGYVPGTTPINIAATKQVCQEPPPGDTHIPVCSKNRGRTCVCGCVCLQVVELLSGKEYEPKSSFRKPHLPPGESDHAHALCCHVTLTEVCACMCVSEGDLVNLGVQVKQQVCQALDREGLWESLAHSLGLGILNMAFRLSPFPAKTLLDSYEVHTHTHTPIGHISDER